MKMKLKRVATDSGFENQEMYLLQYRDYDLIRINTESKIMENDTKE
jgi:hypothetical protein